MIRLLFVVPYPELKEKVLGVIRQHPNKKDFEAEIVVCMAEEMPGITLKKYDAIIARGYSAINLRKMYPQIPTIELHISGYDIIRAISECCEAFHPKKIAICGFGSKLYEAKEVCQHFDVDGEVFSPKSHESLPAVFMKIEERGCDAIIGGYSTNVLAKEHQLNSVLIKTGEDTILAATNEAINTVTRIQAERVTSEMYKTIIYSSKNGIFYVDKSGIIRVRNSTLREMLNYPHLQNCALKDTLPFLIELFENTIHNKGEQHDLIMELPRTKLTVSINCTAVIANDDIAGAVFTFSDITLIQDMEKQIRKKLSERGLQARYHFSDILHESYAMQRTIQLAQNYAKLQSNVLITGETGTGKELFAQSIHNASARKNAPFVAINCAALPENLLESELFGYVEGAFTGTKKGGKVGLFEQAHHGTLFLDEIGEVSLAMQTKLLRVLQEHQVRRVGDDKVLDIDVRIISATNKSLKNLVNEGKFRRDLMYRLDVLRLFIVPLRERGDDVCLLFEYLLKSYCEKSNIELPIISPQALPMLKKYEFEGNIRELENIVQRTVSLQKNGYITENDLNDALYPPDLMLDGSLNIHRENACIQKNDAKYAEEIDAIMKSLERNGGNKSVVANELGMDRTTLWRKIKKYRL